MDYTYIKEHINEVPVNCLDFVNQFENMCRAFDVSLIADHKYKDMDTFFNDITIAYLTYQREVNGMKFSRSKKE